MSLAAILSSEAGEAYDAMKDYERILQEFQKNKDSIQRIEALNPPPIEKKIELEIKLEGYNLEEIERKIPEFNNFKEVYADYDSIAIMEEKSLETQTRIESLKSETQREIDGLGDIIKLISSRKEGKLFSKFLEKGEPLTAEQEAVLFHLINVDFGKPDRAIAGTRYTETMELLDSKNIKKDETNQGLWLKTGPLYEFIIPDQNKKPLFDRPEKLKQAIANQKSELERQRKEKVKKKEEYKRFQTGLEHNLPVEEFDQRLKDHGVFQKLQETAFLIQNLDEMLSEPRLKLEQNEKKLDQLQQKIPKKVIPTLLAKQIGKMEKRKKLTEQWLDKFKQKKVKWETEQTVRENSLPKLEKEYEERRQFSLQSIKNYIAKARL